MGREPFALPDRLVYTTLVYLLGQSPVRPPATSAELSFIGLFVFGSIAFFIFLIVFLLGRFFVVGFV